MSKKPLSLSPTMDLLGEIKSAFPRFHASEQAIASAVLDNPVSVAQMKISDLATHSETSLASIVRFSKALGFKGYPEFRMALVSEVSRRGLQSHQELDSGITINDSSAEIIRKIAAADASAIATTAEMLDIKSFEAAVAAWDTANVIGVIGLASGGYVALDLQLKLNRQGKNSIAWSDAHTALTSVSLLKKGDCLVAISHSGTTIDIVDVMSAFKERGITVILITNNNRGTAKNLADIVLHTSARETTFRSGATSSRIAQLTVVDCLCVALAQRNWSGTKTALDDSRDAIASRLGKKANDVSKTSANNSKIRSRGGK